MKSAAFFAPHPGRFPFAFCCRPRRIREVCTLPGPIKLAVRDLRDAWNARYEADLGRTPANDKDGVLQDVHWYGGTIGGAFQGYTIGNILSAQLFEAAVSAQPRIPSSIEQGDFSELRAWLGHNLHRLGRQYNGPEAARRALGANISTEAYLRYLKQKYIAIYGLAR